MISKTHRVVAVTSDATGEVLRYTVTHGDAGDIQYDVETENVKVVQDELTKNQAKGLKLKLDKDLARFSADEMAKDPHALEAFDVRLPDDPRTRAAAFRSLDQETQEALVYSALCTTGLTVKKIAQWLCIKPTELEHIHEDVILAARAELELRIAKRMMFFAMANKSPAAMSATIYLTKAMLKWSETGDGTSTGAAPVLDINLKVINNTNDDVNALRVELDDMVKAAEAKQAARLQ